MSENVLKTYQINPLIDHLFGFFGNTEIKTKQDKFKPVEVNFLNEDGTEEILEEFYVRNPSSKAFQAFEGKIRAVALEVFSKHEIICKPQEIEIFLAISMKLRRFKEVDVDNLAKSVLDCLNGIVYEDDSQVSNLIVKKSIHPLKIDSILIGVTRLTEERQGLIGDLYLFS